MESRPTVLDQQLYLVSPIYNQRVKAAFFYYQDIATKVEQDASNLFNYRSERADLESCKTDKRIAKALDYYVEAGDGTLTEKETVSNILDFQQTNFADLRLEMMLAEFKSMQLCEVAHADFLAARIGKKEMLRTTAKEALKVTRLRDLSEMVGMVIG
jgi:hypothetical protein